MKDTQTILNRIKEIPWKQGEYKKQNWGIWLHRVSSYVGRIKPAFAHWLIKTCSNENDVVLDPFCGIGTVVLEADLLHRKSIGIDLNPYAYYITKAKFDRRGLKEELDFLRDLKSDPSKVDLTEVPDWVKEYYHPNTLKEIISLRDILIQHERFFLLGCLLGICHGHRPQHLSIRTGYIIPYIPNPKPKVEYRQVIPRMIYKVKRMYRDRFPLETDAKVYLADARHMPLESHSVDIIISSPPYYNTLDYVDSNKLRLWFLRYEEENQEKLKKSLIQHYETYLHEMDKIADEIKRVMKEDGLVIFVLGDVHTPSRSINTAKNISYLYKAKGFITHGIIADEIPANMTTIVKFNGADAIKRKMQKMDRITVMTLS